MALGIIAAVVFALLVWGVIYCLIQEKNGSVRKKSYYIGKELRHGFGWVRLIFRG